MPEYNVSVYIDDSQKPDLYLSSGAAARISLFLMFIGFIGTIAAGVFEKFSNIYDIWWSYSTRNINNINK